MMAGDFKTERERLDAAEIARAEDARRERDRNHEQLVDSIVRGMGYSRAKAERIAASMLGRRARDPLAGRVR